MVPGAQTTEPLSIWSLLLGIASFVFFGPLAAIPAIITGVKAKKAIDASGGTKSGRSAATAGEVLGIVNLVFSALAIGVIVVVISAASKHTAYNDLQVGDCYNRISSGSIFSGEVDKISCGKPHDAEVTGTFQATNPGSYPGPTGFRDQAQSQCLADGRAYLGGNSGTGLDAIWLSPSQATWDTGIRTVVCGIQNADGSRSTGSVRG